MNSIASLEVLSLVMSCEGSPSLSLFHSFYFYFILFHLPILLSFDPTDPVHIQFSVFVGFPGIWISGSLNLYLFLVPFLRLFYLCLLVLSYSIFSLGFFLIIHYSILLLFLGNLLFSDGNRKCLDQDGRENKEELGKHMRKSYFQQKGKKSLPYITMSKLCG